MRARGESWDYPEYLRRLCEVEWEARHGRKLERLLKGAKLPEGKTLAILDETKLSQKLSQKLRRTLKQLIDGGFVERRENVIAFGLPGRGKTHYLSAVAHELIIRHQYRVLFVPTFKLVQQLLAAKSSLNLEAVERLVHHSVLLEFGGSSYRATKGEKSEKAAL